MNINSTEAQIYNLQLIISFCLQFTSTLRPSPEEDRTWTALALACSHNMILRFILKFGIEFIMCNE